MTEFERLQKHIDEFTCRLHDCEDENLKCFYQNAIIGMKKKMAAMSLKNADSEVRYEHFKCKIQKG